MRTRNKSFFHYRIEKHSNNEILYTKYYMTMDDIKKDFNISRHTLSNLLKNPEMKSKKFKDLKIFRDYKAAYQIVPILQENI